MKKRILLIITFIVVGLIVIYFITESRPNTWVYSKLPNNYVIEKFNETEIKLGKIINNTFKVIKNDKKIGVDDYIAEFSYGNNYISLKCIETKKDTIIVKFYIIDSKNEDVYGPYNDETTYKQVKDKIIDEELNDWIKTINDPNNIMSK